MQAHAIYLAIIAVLIIGLVAAGAFAVRLRHVLNEIRSRYGLSGDTRASLAPRLELSRAANRALPRSLADHKKDIDTLVDSAIAGGEFESHTVLGKACADALRGGKRIRGAILLEVARVAGRGRVDASEAALFIEYLHAASLVIDDTPAFDNDSVRRGRPAIHAATNPAVAQMAALAILAAAFQNVCRQIDWIRDHLPELGNPDRIGTRICSLASQAIGGFGAAGGQYMDISDAASLEREFGPDAIAELIYRKTATFFEIATTTGWLVAGGDPREISTVREIGRLIGIAFQIADDVGDAERDARRAASGKPGWNFANEYGRDVAAREVERNIRGARLLLAQTKLLTPLWSDEIFPAIRAMMNE